MLVLLVVALSVCYVLFHIVYNLYFHPLSKYPGPLLARISPLYSLYHVVAQDLHLDILRCHEIYGK